MKLLLAIAATTIAATAWTQAVVLKGSGGYGLDSPYNRLFSRSSMVTFSGKVVGKTIAPPMNGMAEGMSILVRMPNKRTMQVDVGPRWFIADQVARVNIGDSVKVTGSRVRIKGSDLILASTITKGMKVLALRDLRGVPYWVAARPAVAATTGGVRGTIIETNTYNIDGVEHVGYIIDAGNGTRIEVAAAPQWFLDRQDVRLKVGNGVTIMGAQRVYQPGRYVTIADSITFGGTTLLFRSDGATLWNP